MKTSAPWSEDDIRRAGIFDNAVFLGRISLFALLYFAYRFPLNFGFLGDLAKGFRIMIAWVLLITVYNGIHFYATHFTVCKKFQGLGVLGSRLVPRMLAQNLTTKYPSVAYRWSFPFMAFIIVGGLCLIGMVAWLLMRGDNF